MTKVTVGFSSFANELSEWILPHLTRRTCLFEVCHKLFFHFSPDLSNGHFPEGLPTTITVYILLAKSHHTLYITHYNTITYHTNLIQHSRHSCTNTTKWLACTTKYFIMYVLTVLTLYIHHIVPNA